jgi:hypothetical protein
MSTSGGTSGGTSVTHSGYITTILGLVGITTPQTLNTAPLWVPGQPAGLINDGPPQGAVLYPLVTLGAGADNSIDVTSALTVDADAYDTVQHYGELTVWNTAGTDYLSAYFGPVVDSTYGTQVQDLFVVTSIGADLSIVGATSFASAAGLVYNVRVFAQPTWA